MGLRGANRWLEARFDAAAEAEGRDDYAIGTYVMILLRGNPGGSLEATRRSFNKDFLLALAADFKKHGAAAIEKVRKQQPAAYMKICALLVPREMKVEHSSGIKAMTDEQIERSIEFIKEELARREAGANAKVIEGVSERSAPSKPKRERVGAPSGRILDVASKPKDQGSD